MLLWPPLAGTQLSPMAPRSWFFPAATPRATATTGGLHQVRVSDVVCVFTLGAALRETRFSEQGQPEEVDAGCTFFWSSRPKAEQRDAGVAFAIQNDIIGRLPFLPQGINDRLMSLCLPLLRDKFATIISSYAPPMTSSDAAREKLYEDLQALLETKPKVDKPDPSEHAMNYHKVDIGPAVTQ
ncbi:unnamed protein product [Schistocephalus solidus]|uniref:Uncharacterized protein n=1 Tax=Schistocephalus solidus TaxID=70667 RepID=A0A183T9T6_SCHSO|nr:unnamed protein product [Schistocephalus solidus]